MRNKGVKFEIIHKKRLFAKYTVFFSLNLRPNSENDNLPDANL